MIPDPSTLALAAAIIRTRREADTSGPPDDDALAAAIEDQLAASGWRLIRPENANLIVSPQTGDPELDVLAAFTIAVDGLTEDQRQRCVLYLGDRYGIERETTP